MPIEAREAGNYKESPEHIHVKKWLCWMCQRGLKHPQRALRTQWTPISSPHSNPTLICGFSDTKTPALKLNHVAGLWRRENFYQLTHTNTSENTPIELKGVWAAVLLSIRFMASNVKQVWERGWLNRMEMGQRRCSPAKEHQEWMRRRDRWRKGGQDE